jgi:RNA polymerase sigma-70 factor (ECF subfamily)
MQYTQDTDTDLFVRLRPRLKRISQRIVRDEAAAEDIVQDCFVKWHGAAKGTLTTPAAWLTTLIKHHSIDHLRKHHREAHAAQIVTDLLPLPSPALPEDRLLVQAELGTALFCMRKSLSGAERLVFVLHESLEFKHAAIAAALGTTPVNTRQHLARARKKLCKERMLKTADDKLCRDLIRRFQIALDGRDVPTIIALLADEQPMFVYQPSTKLDGCANDALYHLKAAA